MHKSGTDYLKKKRSQSAVTIPISIALIGFILYSSWQLDAPWNITLMCLSIPVLWLVIAVGSCLYTGRQIKRESDDDAA